MIIPVSRSHPPNANHIHKRSLRPLQIIQTERNMSPYFILQQSEALDSAKGIGSGWVKLRDTLNNYSKTRRHQL